MTATDTRTFMALMTIAQHHGRPGTPTDQAHVESFFSHLKGDWPHLTEIRDPGALDTELARIRTEYNTVRLHAAIGYVTPDDEHTGRAPRSAAPSRRPRRASASSTIGQASIAQEQLNISFQAATASLTAQRVTQSRSESFVRRCAGRASRSPRSSPVR